MAKPQLPADRLGPKAVVKSESDLGKGLAELAGLEAFVEYLQAEANERIAQVRSETEAAMVVEVGRSTQTIAERSKALIDAIVEYAGEHRAELLTGKGKTRKLTHGEISWRLSPSSVAIEDAADALAKCLGGAENLQALLVLVEKKLAGHKLSDRCCAADVVDVSLGLSKKKIGTAAKEGRLSDDDLARYGMEVVPGVESIKVKVDTSTVRSEAA